MSSANNVTWLSKFVDLSLMYKMNEKWSKTGPLGTPKLVLRNVDKYPSRTNYLLSSVR